MGEYVDLALTPEEAQKGQASIGVMSEMPRYPYGLSISLDHDTLEKLGAISDNWDVGEKFPLDIIVEITGKNENKTQEGAKRGITLQIIAIKPEEYEEEQEEAEEFGEGEQNLGLHGYLRHSN